MKHSIISRVVIKLFVAIGIVGLPMVACVAAVTRAGHPAALIAPTQHVRPFDQPESYGPDNLWEKINGQAEFYLAAGFESLASQLVVVRDNADMLIEVNIYDMGNPVNAFSVFSLQRRDDSDSMDVTPMAYRTENAVYLAHGPYYLEIISMVPLGEHAYVLKQLAQQFVDNTPVQVADMPGIARFPRENQIEGSAAMIPKDAFGFDRLDRVFSVAYQIDGNTVTAYVSERESPTDAQALVKGLYVYFKNFGAQDVGADTPVKHARTIAIMGTYDLMFPIDQYVAGVHEAPTRQQAEDLARLLAESLQP